MPSFDHSLSGQISFCLLILRNYINLISTLKSRIYISLKVGFKGKTRKSFCLLFSKQKSISFSFYLHNTTKLRYEEIVTNPVYYKYLGQNGQISKGCSLEEFYIVKRILFTNKFISFHLSIWSLFNGCREFTFCIPERSSRKNVKAKIRNCHISFSWHVSM